MRALEFLFEAGLANNELRKHGGKYIELLVKKPRKLHNRKVILNIRL